MAKSKDRVESTTSQKARTQRLQEQKKQQQQRQRMTTLGVILLIAGLFIAVALFIALRPADAPIPDGTEERYAGIPQNKNDEGFFVLGRLDAPVSVVEFSSFTCPACLSFYEANMDMIIQFVRDGVISYTFIPRFVGDIRNPEGAAKAAFCAGEQGKFFEMHDTLFSWQTAFGNNAFTQNRLTSGAEALGLSAGTFRGCLGSGRADDHVGGAVRAASERGIEVAPVTLVNGVEVDGNTLASQIQSALGNRTAVPLDSGDEAALETTPEVEAESTEEATPELNLDIAAPIPLGLQDLYAGLTQTTTEEGYYLLGEADAPNQIAEYTSYACAECAIWHDEAESVIPDLVREGQVALTVYPHFAGSVSADTVEDATKAAYCAGQQDAFFLYHAMLFAWHNQFGDEAFVMDRLVAGADNLDLDVEAFQTCLTGETAADYIAAAREMLTEREIDNAPVVTVNGEPIELTVEALQTALEG